MDQRQAMPLRSILKKGTTCTRAKHVRFLKVDEASRDTADKGTTEDMCFQEGAEGVTRMFFPALMIFRIIFSITLHTINSNNRTDI